VQEKSSVDFAKGNISLLNVLTKIPSAASNKLVGYSFTSELRILTKKYEADEDLGTGPETVAPAASSGGKYVPPSMRAGAGRGAGESMRGTGNREDLPTLRVTNISEDTLENDLRELFGVFGRVARVYVGRDRETGAGKGFAFVSFEDRAVAQKALERVNGKGYDNLILSVQWSRKNLFYEPLHADFDTFCF
jgi:RNA recognition motif-containing protein